MSFLATIWPLLWCMVILLRIVDRFICRRLEADISYKKRMIGKHRYWFMLDDDNGTEHYKETVYTIHPNREDQRGEEIKLIDN